MSIDFNRKNPRSVENYAFIEMLRRSLREAGEQFWANHPTDPRRFTWLGWTVNVPPRYYQDIFQGAAAAFALKPESAQIDDAMQAAWDSRYRQYRVEYMSSPATEVVDRSTLICFELQRELRGAALRLRRGEFAEVEALKDRLLAFADEYPDSSYILGPVRLMNGYLFRDPAEWGLIGEGEKKFIERMLSSRHAGVRHAGEEKQRARELRAEPVRLSFRALDGREFDLSKIRGKVVLIDFWATWCGACVAEMPNLKRVYEKYRENGFEVVGISRDAEKDRDKFVKLVEKLGVSWPQWFTPDDTKSFARRYGVHVVPTAFLIDKRGFVVATDAIGEKLEPLVRKHLEIDVD